MGALEQGLKEEELPGIIESWRSANPKIVQFWWDIERTAIDTTKDHKDRKVGKIGFEYYSNTLWMVLPSGRKLAYINPKLQPNRFGKMALTYEGVGTAGKWMRIEQYGGRMTENCCQATARDLLAEAMWRLEKAGLCIVGHVHDEVILEVPEHVHDEVILEVPEGSITVEEVSAIMNQNPPWSEGLILNSSGYSGKYYFKD